jgi:hypothetical protein
MNFKKWLYTEAFELPFSNIQKIYEYYAESYEKYIKAPRTKIEAKLIPLDLSGSKYDFLQYLNPYVEITVKGTLENAAGIYYGTTERLGNHITGESGRKIGRISLSFYNYEHVNYGTIEHEVLHFIQDLIKLHVKSRNKKNPAYGGLPPMPLVKKLMKDREIDLHGNKKERRTKHEYRPIEFYTNLNSLIRSLQYYYVILGDNLSKAWINNERLKSLSSGDPNDFKTWIKDGFETKLSSGDLVGSSPLTSEMISEWIKNKKNKHLFLKKLINRKDYIVSDLEKVKNLDEELYKIYLREIYKNFIDNNNFASNASEVKKIIDSMKQSKNEKESIKREKEQKKEEKKEKLKEKTLSDKWNEADFTGRVSIEYYDLEEFSDIYDSDSVGYTNREIAEDMFKEIELNLNKKDKIAFGISAKNLYKIFSNIKKAKSTFGITNIGKELDQEKIDNNFDYMAKEMANVISHQLNINTWSRGSFKIPSPQEILDIFYK